MASLMMLLTYWLWLLRHVAAASSSNTTDLFIVNDFVQAFQSTCGRYISPVETCPLNVSHHSTTSLRHSAASDLSQCYTSSYKSYFTCSTPRHPGRGMALLPIDNVGIFPEMSFQSSPPTTKPIDVHGNATCSRFPSLVNVLRESCKFDYGFLANGTCCRGGEGKSACPTESFNVLACGIQTIRSYVTCTSALSLSLKNVTDHEKEVAQCVKDRSERISWLPIGYQVESRPTPLEAEKCNKKMSVIALLASLNGITIAVVVLGNWRFWRMVRSKLVAKRRGTSIGSKRTSSKPTSNNSSVGGSGSRTPEEVIGEPTERNSFHHPLHHHHHNHRHLGKIEEEDGNNESPPPASDDIEEAVKTDEINEIAAKVEDFPSRGNSMRADTRRRHSALMQRKRTSQYTSGTAFKFSFLLVYLSIALDIVFTIGVALLFRQKGINVVLFAQFTAWCLRPRPSFFVGIMGLLDVGWMASGFYTMASDIVLTGLGGIMLAISGIYNLYPQNPAKPLTYWNVFNVGAVLSLLPTGILFLTIIFVLISLLCVLLKQFSEDEEWTKYNPGKMFLLPWYAMKKRSRIAWKGLLSSGTRERKVGRIAATRFTSWVKVGYYGLMGCTFLVYLGNWTIWIGFLELSGPLYCPQQLEMVYIMGFGLTTALTITRVVFEL